jgi:hypothetical protein
MTGVTMTSKVKKRLCLKKSGKRVEVRGPIVRWEPDERSAVFSVVISQVNAAGKVVTATGASTALYTNPGSTQWAATAVVTDPALQLELGPATAYATATIQVDGPAYEQYRWTLLTRLVDCDDSK